MVQLSAAFAGQALPLSTRATQSARVVPRCSLAEVEKYFPEYRRNKAPVISFNGEEGIKLQMTRIKAFQEVDNDTPPLLDYSDPDQFAPAKPVPPSAISWPGGDGRGRTMTGTKGSFTQPDLKTYGPFPDFFKVRIPSFCPPPYRANISYSLEILRYVIRLLYAPVLFSRALAPYRFIKSRFYSSIVQYSLYLPHFLYIPVYVNFRYEIVCHRNDLFRLEWKMLKYHYISRLIRDCRACAFPGAQVYFSPVVLYFTVQHNPPTLPAAAASFLYHLEHDRRGLHVAGGCLDCWNRQCCYLGLGC